jgi:hypothetical protein
VTTKTAYKPKGYETISMGKVVYVVVQKNLSLKQNDPSVFTIPCVIGNTSFKKALYDLGASIRYFCVFVLHFFFGIYNKIVKFLKDLINISITLKILIPEN